MGKNQDNDINITFSFTLYLSQNFSNMWSFVCIIQPSKDGRILKHQSMQYLFVYLFLWSKCFQKQGESVGVSYE